ncbi:fructose-bisphosphate aldolase, partial [Candidatus Peregrinibacteria bacterium]|nr:fructose-bisphosphate aldolase [Candidatus Peregrinibacteria bacterium]
AAWSQEFGLVPICEPEILMDGSHTLDECAATTERTLTMLFRGMEAQHVDPALTILKTNMVLSGKALKKDTPDVVASATIRAFHHSLPATLPGIVFLSGGQGSVQATENLDACAREAQKTNAPWTLSFSYGRALQDDALKLWGGKRENVPAAQTAFLKRARLNSRAQEGKYESGME